jgi:hypothetical protein
MARKYVSSTASDFLLRLETLGEGAPLPKLVTVVLNRWGDTQLDALLPSRDLILALRAGLEGWVTSESAHNHLVRLVDDVADALEQRRAILRELLPTDVRYALRDVVGRPFSPDKRAVLTVIDREPMRELVRELLLDAVLQFGKRAAAPVAGVAKGLGSLAKLATDTLKSQSGGLGGLVGAVSSEMERQVEKRAVEFVDTALSGVFSQLADALSDPKRASEAAELRVSLIDGVLELSTGQLERELLNADVPGATELLRKALKRWLASAKSDEFLRQLVSFAFQRDGQRPLREVLTDLGLWEVVTQHGGPWLEARAREIVADASFRQWLTEVLP